MESKKDIESKLKTLDPIKAYILLLLREKNFEPIKGRLWLQKEMFLILSNLEKLKNFLDYEAYFYGPYSESVDVALNQLMNSGLVELEGNRILATNDGKTLAEMIAKRANKQNLDLVREIKDLLNDLSKDELLAFIYYTFPEMTKESVEIRNIQAKRKQLAISLFKKNKVSLSKAAEIAGVSIEEFMNMLSKRKMVQTT